MARVGELVQHQYQDSDGCGGCKRAGEDLAEVLVVDTGLASACRVEDGCIVM